MTEKTKSILGKEMVIQTTLGFIWAVVIALAVAGYSFLTVQATATTNAQSIRSIQVQLEANNIEYTNIQVELAKINVTLENLKEDLTR